MILQDLFEAREGFLYHTMNYNKSIAVFESDMMEARWEHKIPGIPNRAFVGNSFTRDPDLNWSTPVRLTVDHGKLTQTNRIIPLDGHHVFYRKQSPDNPRYAKIRSRSQGGQSSYNDLREEFVVGDIKHLHRYIARIYVSDKDSWIPPDKLRGLFQIVEDYSTKWRIPFVIDPDLIKQVERVEAPWELKSYQDAAD